jgi:hypothetical protein
MTKLYQIEEKPVLTIAALAERAAEADASPDERAALEVIINTVRQEMGKLWYEEMEIIREDAFGEAYGREFTYWNEDEHAYKGDKEYLDAEQDWLEWLEQRCLHFELGGSRYLCNHRIHTAEDWFYK